MKHYKNEKKPKIYLVLIVIPCLIFTALIAGLAYYVVNITSDHNFFAYTNTDGELFNINVNTEELEPVLIADFNESTNYLNYRISENGLIYFVTRDDATSITSVNLSYTTSDGTQQLTTIKSEDSYFETEMTIGDDLVFSDAKSIYYYDFSENELILVQEESLDKLAIEDCFLFIADVAGESNLYLLEENGTVSTIAKDIIDYTCDYDIYASAYTNSFYYMTHTAVYHYDIMQKTNTVYYELSAEFQELVRNKPTDVTGVPFDAENTFEDIETGVEKLKYSVFYNENIYVSCYITYHKYSDFVNTQVLKQNEGEELTAEQEFLENIMMAVDEEGQLISTYSYDIYINGKLAVQDADYCISTKSGYVLFSQSIDKGPVVDLADMLVYDRAAIAAQEIVNIIDEEVIYKSTLDNSAQDIYIVSAQLKQQKLNELIPELNSSFITDIIYTYDNGIFLKITNVDTKKPVLYDCKIKDGVIYEAEKIVDTTNDSDTVFAIQVFEASADTKYITLHKYVRDGTECTVFSVENGIFTELFTTAGFDVLKIIENNENIDFLTYKQTFMYGYTLNKIVDGTTYLIAENVAENFVNTNGDIVYLKTKTPEEIAEFEISEVHGELFLHTNNNSEVLIASDVKYLLHGKGKWIAY